MVGSTVLFPTNCILSNFFFSLTFLYFSSFPNCLSLFLLISFA